MFDLSDLKVFVIRLFPPLAEKLGKPIQFDAFSLKEAWLNQNWSQIKGKWLIVTYQARSPYGFTVTFLSVARVISNPVFRYDQALKELGEFFSFKSAFETLGSGALGQGDPFASKMFDVSFWVVG
jgi:hypothetical protein